MYPVPKLESERLLALYDASILETPPTEAIEAIVDIAQRVCDAPISLISLIDVDRQWFMAKRGLHVSETERQDAFCNHTIMGEDTFVVEDATRDPRFADNRFVAGEPGIRFYAGQPLIERPGVAYGSLCVIDNEPRTLKDHERDTLRDLAKLTVELIRAHRKSLDFELCRRRFMQTERIARVGGWELDLATGRQEWSDEAHRITGIPRSKVFDAVALANLFDAASRPLIAANRHRALSTGVGIDVVNRITTPDGEQKWVHVVGDVEHVAGAPKRMFGVIQDVSERRRAEDILKRAAFTDLMTDLPNRAKFAEVVKQRLAAPGATFGLLLVNLDRLKTVNDTLGHDVGDIVIKTVAARLLAAGGAMGDAASVVFRLDGDEFAVIVDRCDDADRLKAAAESILRAIEEPVPHDGGSITPRATVGGALSKRDGETYDILLQNADFALGHAKDQNLGGFVMFEDGLRSAILHRIEVIGVLRGALRDDRVMPYYQPIVRLDTSEIVGVEALARMRAPNGRIVAAGEFQEALSDPKVSYDLTNCMLRSVAADLGRWPLRRSTPGYVAFNVGMIDFQRGDLEERIETAFDRNAVPLTNGVLEVTETVFLGGRDDAVARTIGRLRDKGLSVALDDFGTGHASLTHLRTFPVDIIKIDKTFVDGLMIDGSSLSIVDTLISLAKKLGMKVVAEGVETIEQAERLRGLGCDFGQGYLFARPACWETTASLIEAFRAKESPQTRQPIAVAV